MGKRPKVSWRSASTLIVFDVYLLKLKHNSERLCLYHKTKSIMPLSIVLFLGVPNEFLEFQKLT